MEPVRILFVIGSLLPGGIEIWLMNVLRNIDPRRFHIDILVSTPAESPLVSEVTQRGSKILICKGQSKPLRYSARLARLLRAEGPYDIIHSNVHNMNAAVALAAMAAGIPVRIAHSHLAESGPRAAHRKLALLSMRALATGALACSADAGNSLFGDTWEQRIPGRVLECGIDLQPFRAAMNSSAVRESLGIPQGAMVIGHAGRFHPQKNHALIIDVAEAYARSDSRAHFLLVGDGPLGPEIRQRISRSPVASRFHLPGMRADVPQLMLAAMDCFLFPSLYEGLGLALVEAQAAGLPCVFSDVIPAEADVYPPLLRRIPLDASPETWAEAIRQLLAVSDAESSVAALKAVESSPFNILNSIRELEGFYLERCRVSSSPRLKAKLDAFRQ